MGNCGFGCTPNYGTNYGNKADLISSSNTIANVNGLSYADRAKVQDVLRGLQGSLLTGSEAGKIKDTLWQITRDGKVDSTELAGLQREVNRANWSRHDDLPGFGRHCWHAHDYGRYASNDRVELASDARRRVEMSGLSQQDKDAAIAQIDAATRSQISTYQLKNVLQEIDGRVADGRFDSRDITDVSRRISDIATNRVW